MRGALVSALVLAAALPLAFRAGAGYERERSTHFLLLHDVEFETRTGRGGSGRFERGVLQSLEESHRALDALLAIAPRRRVDVVVHDPGRFDRDLAWRFRFPSAGFYGERIHVRGSHEVDAGLEAVLAHELVHAAVDEQAPSRVVPGWVNEGLAMWFEARRAGKRRLSPGERSALYEAAARGGWIGLDRLSTPSFAAFGRGEAHRAYLQSYALIAHLVERRGERALRDFVRRVLRTGDPGSALRRAARMEPAELDRSLRQSLGG